MLLGISVLWFQEQFWVTEQGKTGDLGFRRSCTILLLNSIAFGNAPRREADSQPISQLARPAVSQPETHTWVFWQPRHTLGFLADSAPSSGEDGCPQGKQWPNSNASDRRLLGRQFEPWLGEHAGVTVNDSRLTRIRTGDPKVCSRLHYHLTGVCCDSRWPPHCLEPFDHKLLTPPTPPRTPQKSDIQF